MPKASGLVDTIGDEHFHVEAEDKLNISWLSLFIVQKFFVPLV